MRSRVSCEVGVADFAWSCCQKARYGFGLFGRLQASGQRANGEVSRGGFEIVLGHANVCELLGMAWSNSYGSISSRVLKLGGKSRREQFIPDSVTNLVVRV